MAKVGKAIAIPATIVVAKSVFLSKAMRNAPPSVTVKFVKQRGEPRAGGNYATRCADPK